MISVVIPHYQDLDNLKISLEQLRKQDFRLAYEVIVIDDGSSPDTMDFLTEWSTQKHPYHFQYQRQEHQLQGLARNRGVRLANYPLIVFLQSDVWAEPSLLSTYAEFHQKYPDEKIMAIGPYPFSPDLPLNPFRNWLEKTGLQARFSDLNNYQTTDFWHFYTGNLSLKKSWFEKFQFPNNFSCYGWEDIYLGYQMIRSGGELYYLEQAQAFHHHDLNQSNFFPDRMLKIGYSAYTFQKLCPELNILPHGLKKFIFSVLSLSCFIKIAHYFHSELGWYAESKKWFLKGIEQAKKENLNFPKKA